jgi:DNA-binding protein YbaB
MAINVPSFKSTFKVHEGEHRANLKRIRQFERELDEVRLVEASTCGRVTIEANGHGKILLTSLANCVPQEIGIEELEDVVLQAIFKLTDRVNRMRDQFYGNVTLDGETIVKWQKYPPPQGDPRAMFIAEVNAHWQRGLPRIEGSE